MDAGKGDKQRPTDRKAFGDNYDVIFRKTKEDGEAEDEEFKRIEREQLERQCKKENP
jgi:hypothetical protein